MLQSHSTVQNILPGIIVVLVRPNVPVDRDATKREILIKLSLGEVHHWSEIQ